MAMREIDETEFLNNQKLKDTVAKMLAKPESRKLVLQAQKIVDPTAVIPELDAAKPVEDAVAAVRKEFSDFRSELAKEKEEDQKKKIVETIGAKIEAGRQSLREAGYTEDGIKEVEALMEKRNLVEYEDGQIVFEKLHPPAQPGQPSTYGLQSMLEPKDGTTEEDMKKLFESKGEDTGVLNKMINSALAESRGQNRR